LCTQSLKNMPIFWPQIRKTFLSCPQWVVSGELAHLIIYLRKGTTLRFPTGYSESGKMTFEKKCWVCKKSRGDIVKWQTAKKVSFYSKVNFLFKNICLNAVGANWQLWPLFLPHPRPIKRDILFSTIFHCSTTITRICNCLGSCIN